MKDLGVCPRCGSPILKYQRVYCSSVCARAARRGKQQGEQNPCWRGGCYVEPGKGYILVRKPDHPRARQNGYVLEHILVIEEKIGRPLDSGEVVHHANGDPADNRPENLALYSSNVAHRLENGHCRGKGPQCRCGRNPVARGMCSRCYAYWRRTGNTRPPLDCDGRIHPLGGPSEILARAKT